MKNKIFKLLAVFAGVAASLTSCLEDDKYALDPSTTQNVIEFLDPSVPVSPLGSVYPAFATSYVLAPSAQFEIQVSYSGPQDNGRAIDVVLTVDEGALAAYNHQQITDLHGPTFEIMPASNFDIPNLEFTIPAGQKTVTVPITVYPELFDFSKNFAIPLRIQSSSHGVLSAHYSVAICGIGVRNSYDGVYEIMGGNMFRNGASGPDPVLGGDYLPDIEVDLTTITSNSVAFQPVWKDGSPVGGIDGTYITITETPDANGNYPITLASTGNASLKNTAGLENHYDPETREFTININWGTAPSNRIITGLKLRYDRARP